jgi:hypothetical protein
MSNKTIKIWWDVSVSAYRVSFPYNKDLVDVLSRQIPVSDRHYDMQTRIWTVVERQLPAIRKLFDMLQATVVIVTRQQAEAQQTATQSGQIARGVKPLDSVLIEFVRLLPYDAAKTAYRKAVMQLHPDMQSGDADRASALNVAWQRIEKEVYNVG